MSEVAGPKLIEDMEEIKFYDSDCNCWGDHYGMATNPNCLLHGHLRKDDRDRIHHVNFIIRKNKENKGADTMSINKAEEATATQNISLSDIKDRFSSLNHGDRLNVLEFMIENMDEGSIADAIVTMKLSREAREIANNVMRRV